MTLPSSMVRGLVSRESAHWSGGFRPQVEKNVVVSIWPLPPALVTGKKTKCIFTTPRFLPFLNSDEDSTVPSPATRTTELACQLLVSGQARDAHTPFPERSWRDGSTWDKEEASYKAGLRQHQARRRHIPSSDWLLGLDQKSESR